MEIKIHCGCGSKYSFDVEPVNGRMPVLVQCPSCGTNGTPQANEIIARSLGTATGAAPASINLAAQRGVAVAPPAVQAPVPAAAHSFVPPPPAAGTLGLRISRTADGTPVDSGSAYGTSHGARSLLDRHILLVKERVAYLKLTDTYDILDPSTGQNIGIAREEPPVWAKYLRLAVSKQSLPTSVNVYEHEGAPPVLSVRRGFTFLRSKIKVISGDGRNLGYFRSKLISIGGGFTVFDHTEQQVAEVKGDWKGWNFRFLNKGGREIGTVTKKWAGLGKELFTSADNYVIALSDLSGAGPDTTALLLAAGLSIDIVFKEGE